MLQNLRLDALDSKGPIDAGAEEELFRDVSRQAAAAVLSRRWESAGTGQVGQCGHCGAQLQDLGLRSKRFQTLCGPMQLQRRVGYCGHCHATTAALDERLGASDTLLKDTLGFSPCSSREIERIVNRHGEEIGKLEEAVPVVKHPRKKIYCIAIDVDHDSRFAQSGGSPA